MPDTPDPVRLARKIADALEEVGIPYAIGGAIALAYWAPPRGTVDVDLNIFVGPDKPKQVAAALDVLGSVGVVLDRVVAWNQVKEGGRVRGWVGRTAVDSFFDSIDLHKSAARRVVLRPLVGRPAHILAAEDLVVLKLLFFRGKDILDVERIVAMQGSTLDRKYIRTWLVECMGEDDDRILEWDRLVIAANSPE